MTLYRGYHNIQPFSWTKRGIEFIGTIDREYPAISSDGIRKKIIKTIPCYGWSKGGSFFIYTIDSGHISKLGTVKRNVVIDDDADLV